MTGAGGMGEAGDGRGHGGRRKRDALSCGFVVEIRAAGRKH